MKTKNTPFFFFVFVAVFVLSNGCENGGPFGKDRDWPCDEGLTKSMRFVQYGTDIPIEGAQISLYSYSSSEEFPSQVEYRTTDSNGFVTWPCEQAVTDICGEAEGYWDNCGYGYDMNMTWVADGVYELLPKAWAKVIVSDVEPLNEGFFVDVSFPNGGLAETIPDNHPVIRDCVGNKEDFLKFYVRKWDAELEQYINLFHDSISINVAPFDTSEIFFNY